MKKPFFILLTALAVHGAARAQTTPAAKNARPVLASEQALPNPPAAPAGAMAGRQTLASDSPAAAPAAGSRPLAPAALPGAAPTPLLPELPSNQGLR